MNAFRIFRLTLLMRIEEYDIRSAKDIEDALKPRTQL